MIRRAELNKVFEKINQRQNQEPEKTDLFKEMLNMSKPKLDKPGETSTKESIKPADKKIDKEKPEKDLGTKKPEEGKSDKTETVQVPNQTVNSGDSQEVDPLQANQLLGNIQDLSAGLGREVAIDEETQIYSQKNPALDSGLKLDENELQKRLDNAFLFRPEIKDKTMEKPDFTDFAARLTNQDLEENIRELTGQEVKVEFTKTNKEDETKNLIDNLVNQQIEQPEEVEIKPVVAKEGNDIEFEKIFIKVSDGEEIGPKLAQEIRDKILINQTDSKNYEIQLNPANLGKIFVKVSLENGVTNLQMEFSSRKTMEMMTKNMDQLSQILANSRGTEVTVNMTEEAMTDYLKEDQEQNQSNPQEQKHREEERQSQEFINRLKDQIRNDEFARI